MTERGAALSNLASLPHLLPELLLGGGVLALVLFGLLAPAARVKAAAGLTLVVLAAAAGATMVGFGDAPRGLFGGLVARDPFSDFFRIVVLTTTAVVALLAPRSRDTFDERRSGSAAPEFYALLLAASLGCLLMAAATDLLMVYLAIELASLASYVLVGYTPGARRSAEASLKYIIYGGVASGTMLYGMSLFYGLAASTDLTAIRQAAAGAPPLVVLLAAVLVLAGLGYKVAIVPFHMWCPDVYEGAPTPITAFLSVAPKAAGFALLLRVFTGNLPDQLAGGAAAPWAIVALVLGAATMTLGNLGALGQRNVKRLLAYSSIAHAGTLLLGLAAGAPGAKAVLVYTAVYLFMNLTAFAVVSAVVNADDDRALDAAGTDPADLSAFAGLGHRAPLAALALTIALFALAGLPPTGGFVAKYYLFSALVEEGRRAGATAFYVAALVGVLNSVLSLAYYARLLRVMHFESVGAPGRQPRVSPALLVALALPILLLGIYWGPLDGLADGAMSRWTSGLAGR